MANKNIYLPAAVIVPKTHQDTDKLVYKFCIFHLLLEKLGAIHYFYQDKFLKILCHLEYHFCFAYK